MFPHDRTRNPDADAGSAVSSRFLCNEIVRQEKKEGYLERKQAAEAKRLEQEKKVLDLIGNTSERCRDSLTKLDKTRVVKSGSESYEQLHKVLEVGAKLGSQTSVRDMTEFLRLFNEASESYSLGHNTLLGPLTGDGIKRLEESQTLNEFGKQASETLKALSKDLGTNTRRSACGSKTEARTWRI